MNSNLVICRNEVIIEGVSVGPFESFSVRSNFKEFGETATLTIPLYAIGTAKSGPARSRVRTVFKSNQIKTLAEVEVYLWYEGLDKIKAFHGFIEQVVEGFPSVLHLRDFTFLFRFGSLQKSWPNGEKLQNIIKECIPIAQEAFTKEREAVGFTRSVPTLSYSDSKRVLQAETTLLDFKNAVDYSPYDTMVRLMQQLALYGGVFSDGSVYMGGLSKDSSETVEKLDTRYNVIARDLIRQDSRFIHYDVRVVGILADGKRYTGIAGVKGGKSNSELDTKYGESVRVYSNLRTTEGIDTFADNMKKSLQGVKNKGTITTLLYPKMSILQSIEYTDSLFEELSGLYFVMGYELNASNDGYFQRVTVTDKVFAI